ncbi:hypothetical protein B0H63DRAFT_510320 [Podospora didyma]|uniref:NodB homology domain-containing protein n=1 Tax=Podospora didyma TaxID=330526 RepID=A0AAE0NPV9_9PEZI|nr:hypothetical protein B0H63DRAFT_510320 [Podospora didyma]
MAYRASAQIQPQCKDELALALFVVLQLDMLFVILDFAAPKRPTFGNVPYGVGISHCSVTGKVALTFDDGPYIYTTELLDLLKQNNVRASFFVVGNNAGKGRINDPSSGYAPIIQRMIADGHQVGSHTWSHQDLNAATREQRRAQIIHNEIALNSILGVIPTYFRPPYTRCAGECLDDLKSWGYHVVNYDIDTRDWQDGGVKAKSTYQTILSEHSAASSAWISLAHDVEDFTVHHFAQFMIDTARRLGYELVPVGTCLGDPPENWYRDPITGQARDVANVAIPLPSKEQPKSSSTSTSSSQTTSLRGSTSTSSQISSIVTVKTSTSETQTVAPKPCS